jgi:amidohydrolase
MIDKIKQLSKEFLPEIIRIRRHIHQHPELSFEEYKTAEFIQSELIKIGIPFTYGHVNTGIVGTIEGKDPHSKTILLRADIDALPIQEENDVQYKSNNDGVMHACGHDAHSASLLGSAMILNQLKNDFSGTIKLLFQPAEEKLPGGAKLLIEEGVIKKINPNKCIAQHVYPELPVGKVGFKKGVYMASTDELHVTVNGKGGHAALPHQLIDPVLISAQIIVGLQQIISRSNNPITPSVLSFGFLEAKGATNVIPNNVSIKGTFRTFDEKWREEAHLKMIKMATSIADSMGGSCDFEIKKGYPFLINDEDVTSLAIDAAQMYLGEENVVPLDLRMTAEDFAYLSHEYPSCFYRLGTANENKNSNLHTPTFDIDETSLEIGSGLFSFIAIQQLYKS